MLNGIDPSDHCNMSASLSADVDEPTCFTPFNATTRAGFCTVVQPVINSFRSKIKPIHKLKEIIKKSLTAERSNDVDLVKEVASGILRYRLRRPIKKVKHLPFTFIKKVNQPAFLFSLPALCI